MKCGNIFVDSLENNPEFSFLVLTFTFDSSSMNVKWSFVSTVILLSREICYIMFTINE